MTKRNPKKNTPSHSSSLRYSSIEGPLLADQELWNDARADQAGAAELFASGIVCHFKKEFNQAYRQIEKAYQLYLSNKDFLGAIRCLIELGWINYRNNENNGPRMGYDTSIRTQSLFAEARAMIDAHINTGGIQELQACLLHYEGLVHYGEKRFGEGMSLFRQALTFCKPHSLEAGRIHDSLAVYYERIGDFHRAIQSLKKALQIKKSIGIPYEEAISCQILGRLYSHTEEYDNSLLYLEHSLEIVKTLQDQKRLLSLKNDLVKVYIHQQNLQTAQTLITETLPQDPNQELSPANGMTYLYQAYLLALKKNFGEACHILEKTVFPVFERYHFQKGLGKALRLKASIADEQEDISTALENFSQAVAIFKETKQVDELTKTYYELSKIYDIQGDHKLALKYLLEALKNAESNGLTIIASYIEDEIYRLDLSQWKEIVNKRANHERVFEKEPNLLDALSALSENGQQEESLASLQSEESIPTPANPLISLLRVGQAMSAERELDRLLTLIREETEKSLNADRCTVFLYDRTKNELWSKVASGLDSTEEIRFPAHLGLAGYVCKTGEILNIKNAYEDPRFNKEVDKKTGYKTKNLLCMPMINRNNEIIGVFQVLNKRKSCFEKLDEDLLMAIAASAAVAIENARLATDQKVAFESFIKTLSSTIDARDPITAGHSERVAEYSQLLGEQLLLEAEDLEVLKYASLLHDIGKIGIREDILMKDGRLTQKEYRHIQKHAYYTYEILKNIHFEHHLKRIPEIAAVHHEKVDGTGYFRGLTGAEIPLSGRILALSDVFDAITSRRHYRNRMPFEKVLSVMRRDTGSHFDPDCINCFFNSRLYQLGKILLMEKSAQGVLDTKLQHFSTLKELDKDITVVEYEAILKKEKLTKEEAKVHDAFKAIYHSIRISDFD